MASVAMTQQISTTGLTESICAVDPDTQTLITELSQCKCSANRCVGSMDAAWQTLQKLL